MEMERQRVQRELDMEARRQEEEEQRRQRVLEMEARRQADKEQWRQRELEMEACRQAEKEYYKLEMERKRKRQDQEMAEIAKDVYNFKGPMPIPVPSGFVDTSGPREWEEWWRLYPNGTGPLPHVDIVKRSLDSIDFTPPGGKRHPGERFVDVLGLVNAGLISEADIAKQRAFTDEELREKMEALASLGIDSMIGC